MRQHNTLINSSFPTRWNREKQSSGWCMMRKQRQCYHMQMSSHTWLKTC